MDNETENEESGIGIGDVADGILILASIALIAGGIYVVGYDIYHIIKVKVQAKRAIKKACKILKLSPKNLKTLTKVDLTRAYRKQAKVFHPDHGGSDDEFKNLHKAYEFIQAVAFA